MALDYYFSLVSPFAYLGHARLLEVAARHKVDIVYRPVRLAGVFAESGTLPLAQRPLVRQRYRLVELQRWREYRGLPLNLAPKYFPADASLADRSVIAMLGMGGDPARYMGAVYRALWVEDRDIADREVLGALLAQTGHDAQALLSAAGSAAVGIVYDDNTVAASAADLPGMPGYVLAGEPFWGQDRIELLDAALTSARHPYLPGTHVERTP
jgi:2-hydroxychromene-2-carboxylate isomerase